MMGHFCFHVDNVVGFLSSKESNLGRNFKRTHMMIRLSHFYAFGVFLVLNFRTDILMVTQKQCFTMLGKYVCSDSGE